METPINERAHRHIRLGRSVLKMLRDRRTDQRGDVEQIIEDPKIYEYVIEIARGELDDALMHVNRKRPKREPKIVHVINANASIEYIKSNPEQRKNPRRSYWRYLYRED